MDIRNKNVIITGAASGMGKEMVIKFINNDCNVFALDISQEGLDKLKKYINSEKLVTYKADISNLDDLKEFKLFFDKNYKSVDILMNNAGIIQPFKDIENTEFDVIKRIININFYGCVYLTKLFLPMLKTRKEAAIVNTSSMGGFFPFPYQSVYGASKAAIKLFTEGLYAELIDTNVHVMVVFPGAINTNIAKNSNVKFESSSSSYKMLSANKAAGEIIKGIKKNKFQLFVGSDSKFMNFLYRLSPKRAIKMVTKKMKKMM